MTVVGTVADLLINEVVVTPTFGEYIEIFNPTGSDIDLTGVWLADNSSYYTVPQNGGFASNADFVCRFPDGDMIPAGGYLVVSPTQDGEYQLVYGSDPDYDFDPASAIPTMVPGDFTSGATLFNAAEVAVLFFWDGVSDLVEDIDYVLWADDALLAAGVAVDKTGIVAGASTYLDDTAPALQTYHIAPDEFGQTLGRCDQSEGAELQAGGNGITGADETSEDTDNTFAITDLPTPGAPNLCL